MPTGNQPDRSNHGQPHWGPHKSSKGGSKKNKRVFKDAKKTNGQVASDITSAFLKGHISHNKMATMLKTLKTTQDVVDEANTARGDAVHQIMADLYSAQR